MSPLKECCSFTVNRNRRAFSYRMECLQFLFDNCLGTGRVQIWARCLRWLNLRIPACSEALYHNKKVGMKSRWISYIRAKTKRNTQSKCGRVLTSPPFQINCEVQSHKGDNPSTRSSTCSCLGSWNPIISGLASIIDWINGPLLFMSHFNW